VSNRTADKSQLQSRGLSPDFVGIPAYLRLSLKMSLPEAMVDAVGPGAISFVEEMQPKDPLERLAFSQLLLAYSRTVWLTRLMAGQTDPDSLQVVSEACERAAGTFGRLMRATSEYRSPAGPTTTVSIGQANVAAQQIVQNTHREAKKRDGRTGIGSAKAVTAATLRPHREGKALAPSCNPKNTTVAAEYGPQDGSGKSPNRDERVQARRAVRFYRRNAKGVETGD